MSGDFSMIPHGFLDKLIMSNFKKRQLKILLYMARMTFGCHKREIISSHTEFTMCGVGNNVIKKELEILASMNVIKILDKESSVYNMNPDMLNWLVKPAMRDVEKQRDIKNRVIRRQLKPSDLRTKIYPKQTLNVPNSRSQTPERTRDDNGNSGLKHIGNIVKDIYGNPNKD